MQMNKQNGKKNETIKNNQNNINYNINERNQKGISIYMNLKKSIYNTFFCHRIEIKQILVCIFICIIYISIVSICFMISENTNYINIAYITKNNQNNKSDKSNNSKNINSIIGKKNDIYNTSLIDKKNNLEDKITEDKNRKKNINFEINQTMQEIIQLQKQITEKSIEIDTLNLEIQKMNASMQQIKDKYNVLELKKQEKEYIVKKRLNIIYRNGKYKKYAVLLSSKNVLEFFSNYYMIQKISELDNLALKDYTKDQKTLDIWRKELLEYEKILKHKKGTIAKAKQLQENFIVLKNAKIKELTEEEKNTVNNLEKLEKEKVEVEKQIALSIAQGSLKFDKIPRYIGGEMMWPVPSCQSFKWITAYFGAGYKDGYVGSNHSGVDIAIPSGQVGKHKAVAAQDGRVITAVKNQNGSKVSYGNYIVIDHGGGVYTLYGHAHKVFVNVGDMVKKGQPIMDVGSTGYSTGPHLHFEVRIGGSSYSNRVDPLPYITTMSKKKIPNSQ